MKESDFDGWKSNKCNRRRVRTAESELLKALKNPRDLSTLPSESQELVVDAFAAATHEAALEVRILIGPRSIRSTRGRPWIEEPARAPSPPSRVAERKNAYGSSKTYSVKSPEQGWSIRVVQSESGVNIFWLEGANGVAVSSAEGKSIGSIGKWSPSLSLPGITLPAELRLRAMVTPD